MKKKLISDRFLYREGKPHRYISNVSQIPFINLVKDKIQNGQYPLIGEKCFCGGQDEVLLSLIDRYNLPLNSVMCTVCGTIRIDPYLDDRSTVDFYTNYYQKMYNRSDDKAAYFEKQRLYGRKILQLIDDNNHPIGTVLEIGCGAGGALLEFKQRGIEVFGCEFDEELISFGKSKGLPNIFKGSIEDLIAKVPGQQFDLIFSHHVLEHVRDINSFFAANLAVLPESGRLLHVVPDIFSLNLTHSTKGDLMSMIHIAHKFYISVEGFRKIAARNNLSLTMLHPPENFRTHMTGSPELWVQFTRNHQRGEERSAFNFEDLLEKLAATEDLYQKRQQKRSFRKRIVRAARQTWGFALNLIRSNGIKTKNKE